MLTGILVPTARTVRTCGMHPVSQRKELARRIGVVFGQRSQLLWDLPLRQSYRTLAAIHRLERAAWSVRQDELVDRLDLAPFLSKERLRVFLAEQRATHDTTLLLTTRDMDDAQRLAFSPQETTAAAVLAQVGRRADVHDLTIDEPDIEDVVRRLYLSSSR